MERQFPNLSKPITVGRVTYGNFVPHGVNVHLAAEIKKHVKIPVATLGGLNDPDQIEKIIASGQADIVYMGRALLADPELPRQVTENRTEEIVRCLRCFTCMAERAVTSTRHCAVNPLIGREMDGVEVYPAAKKNGLIPAYSQYEQDIKSRVCKMR